MSDTVIALIAVLAVNIVAIAYGYGKLSQKVSGLYNDLSHITQSTAEIAVKLNGIAERLSRLEGQGGK